MKYLTYIALTIPMMAVAGVPKALSPSEAKDLGVLVKAWEGYGNDDRQKHLEGSSCTPITLYVPMADAGHPEFTRVTAHGLLYREGKVLSDLLFHITNIGTENVLSSCLPISQEYEVNITYSYNPVELNSGLMCPPSFEIKDIKRFIK